MPELTIEQRGILEGIQKAKAERATVKARVEAENRRRLEAEIKAADDLLNRKVREAHEAGISKRRIGREGLGTVDPTIVNRILEKTAQEAQLERALTLVATPAPIREVTHAQAVERGWMDPDADLIVELHYPAFPSQWAGGVDQYPNPLEGVLKRVFGLWYVLEDPSEVFLEWELAEYEPNGGVLKRILDTYAERAA